MEISLYMVQHDTLPVWVDVITDAAKVPVSILGETLKLSMRRFGYADPPVIDNADVQNLDVGTPETVGRFSYGPWQASDTAVAGIFQAELKATSGSGVQRHPTGTFFILIRPAVAP